MLWELPPWLLLPLRMLAILEEDAFSPEEWVLLLPDMGALLPSLSLSLSLSLSFPPPDEEEEGSCLVLDSESWTCFYQVHPANHAQRFVTR